MFGRRNKRFCSAKSGNGAAGIAAAAAKLKNHGSANTYCDIAFTLDDGNELQYDELRPFVCGRYTHCPACGKEEALRKCVRKRRSPARKCVRKRRSPARKRVQGSAFLFSFEGLIRVYPKYRIGHRRPRPAERSKVCKERIIVLFYCPLCKNVHWTVPPLSKFP